MKFLSIYHSHRLAVRAASCRPIAPAKSSLPLALNAAFSTPRDSVPPVVLGSIFPGSSSHASSNWTYCSWQGSNLPAVKDRRAPLAHERSVRSTTLLVSVLFVADLTHCPAGRAHSWLTALAYCRAGRAHSWLVAALAALILDLLTRWPRFILGLPSPCQPLHLCGCRILVVASPAAACCRFACCGFASLFC